MFVSEMLFYKHKRTIEYVQTLRVLSKVLRVLLRVLSLNENKI